jgi:hypothetical protein
LLECNCTPAKWKEKYKQPKKGKSLGKTETANKSSTTAVTVKRTPEIDSQHQIDSGTTLPAPPDHRKRLGTFSTKRAHVRNTMTKPGTMATTGRESPIGAAVEGIRAPAQGEDMNVEAAAGVDVANGTSGDVSITCVASTITIANAAEPLECNENGKRLSGESPEASKPPGEWRSRMERTVRQQAQELAQLHRTTRQITNLLEAHAACEEVQWSGVKAWIDEREGKWEFGLEENVL